MAEDTKQVVFKTVASQLGYPLDQLHATDKLEDLTTDSIQLFELVCAFEERFGAYVEYEDLVGIRTVQDIVDYVDQRLSQLQPNAPE